VGYSGGVISIGVRLAVVEPRIVAAGLFAGSFVPRTMFDEARQVTIPLHVLLQSDDEGNDRQMALDLFDAFGSKEQSPARQHGRAHRCPAVRRRGRCPVLRPAPEVGGATMAPSGQGKTLARKPAIDSLLLVAATAQIKAGTRPADVGVALVLPVVATNKT
jgi:hypothetical protein